MGGNQPLWQSRARRGVVSQHAAHAQSEDDDRQPSHRLRLDYSREHGALILISQSKLRGYAVRPYPGRSGAINSDAPALTLSANTGSKALG
jgi:hypothetical protein